MAAPTSEVTQFISPPEKPISAASRFESDALKVHLAAKLKLSEGSPLSDDKSPWLPTEKRKHCRHLVKKQLASERKSLLQKSHHPAEIKDIHSAPDSPLPHLRITRLLHRAASAMSPEKSFVFPQIRRLIEEEETNRLERAPWHPDVLSMITRVQRKQREQKLLDELLKKA